MLIKIINKIIEFLKKLKLSLVKCVKEDDLEKRFKKDKTKI